MYDENLSRYLRRSGLRFSNSNTGGHTDGAVEEDRVERRDEQVRRDPGGAGPAPGGRAEGGRLPPGRAGDQGGPEPGLLRQEQGEAGPAAAEAGPGRGGVGED